jgi:hypothetical protein
MKRLYAYDSSAGTFYICRITNDYFTMFESRLIDSHPTAERAAQALSVNHNITLPPRFSFDEIKIPGELSQWEQIG